MDNTFTPKLLEWYDAHGRDLPWRHTQNPYAIWLSEIILQQTRVVQGMDYWQRFMTMWPTVEKLAEASEDEVLRLWQGLGYYSRARNLHVAAKQIVALGHFPDTLDEIKKLKGVGDYTASAIASFAFGIPTAAVDGNYYRVLARYEGIDTPINSTDGKKLFAQLAQNIVAYDRPADFNQAMMDFGATQCTPKSPDCSICPFAEECVAYRTGQVDRLPVKLKTIKMKTRQLTYIYIRYEGKIAIRRRPAGDIWQGLWEPLLIENQPIPVFSGEMTLLRQQVKHVLSHRILLADFYLLEAKDKPILSDEYIWIKEADIEQYALPRLIEILIDSLPR